MAKNQLGDPVANRAGPRDRVVALRQVFDAEREWLFRAWTDPLEFAKWWGPKGWNAFDCALDARPGGRWSSSFARPGQPSIHVGGTYHEVVAPELLVFSWDSYGAGATESLSLVRIEFIALGPHTELVVTHRELTTGEAYDMDVGWLSAFECLAAYIAGPAALASVKPSSTPQEGKQR